MVSADRKYVTMEVRPSSVKLIDVFTEIIVAPFSLGGGDDDFSIITIGEFPIDLPNVEVSTLRSIYHAA